jgi:antitoxin HicB
MGSNIPRFEISPLSQEDGGGYLISFPDYPGCIADGETVFEAIAEGQDALKAYTEGLADMGYPVEEKGEPSFSGKWTQRVPKSLHAAVIKKAETEGVSLNAYVSMVLAGSVSWEGHPELAKWATEDAKHSRLFQQESSSK